MKIKVFGVKANGFCPKLQLEEQINKFITDKDVVDIKFDVVKNYLPHTTSSEFEETLYAMVIYK